MNIKIYIVLTLLQLVTLVKAQSSVDIPCILQRDSHTFTQSQSPARIKDIVTGKGELDKERALECQLRDKDSNIAGRVLLEIVIVHDPPTELLLHVAYMFMDILESKRLICSYKDIGAEFHIGNVMPEKIKHTGKNGTYRCSENGLEIVLTGLLRDRSKIRTKKDAPEPDMMCVRDSLRPPQRRQDEGAYCVIENGNGTAGVLIYNEKGVYICSRCCAQTYSRNGICNDCPECTKQEISIWSSCDPVPCDSTGDEADDTDVSVLKPPAQITTTETSMPTTTAAKAETFPTPQHAPVNVVMTNRSTTSVYLTWNVETLETLTHFLVCVEVNSTTKPYTTKGNAKEIYIESLKPDTEYNITVAVAHFNETGPKSKVIKIKTLFQIPDVKNFNASVYSNVAHLSWMPQEKFNLTLTATLMLLDANDSQPQVHNVLDSDGKMNVPLDKPGNYSVTVHYFDHVNNRNGTELSYKFERHLDQAESAFPNMAIVLWGLFRILICPIMAVILICYGIFRIRKHYC